MKPVGVFTAVVCASVLLAVPSWAEEKKGDGPKVDLKAAKGTALAYTVKRSSDTETESARGDFRAKQDVEAEYRIEVKEKKDGGEVVLVVSCSSLKARLSGRESDFEFDSSKKDSGGGEEAAKALHEAIGKPIIATIAGGKVSKVEGISEPERPEGNDRSAFQSLRIRRLLSRRSIEQDLEAILCSAVQGASLEKGKEYRPARREPSGEGEGRRRFFGRFGGGEVRFGLKFEGEEKADGKAVAKFSVQPAGQAEGGEGFRREEKVEGTALLSLDDGLLMKLEVRSESKTEGTGDREFKSRGKSTITVTRGAAPPAKKEAVSL